MKEVELPSGQKLKIGNTPFSESKALFQAILEEFKNVGISSEQDHITMLKDLFCSGFSSKKVESALMVCMKRCTYGGLKVDESTFEPPETRQDYIPVCVEVAVENVSPFLKGLSLGLKSVSSLMPSSPK